MKFSDRLKQTRVNLKLNQQAMADELGVALRTYQRYEIGECVPTADILGKLAVHGVDFQWLLTGTPNFCTYWPIKPGVIYFAFRSEQYADVESILKQAGMSSADLYFLMNRHLSGVIDGLKFKYQAPF